MVRKTVIADDMTLFFHPLQNDFITRNAVANAKKSGFYIRLPEYIQDFGRMCRGRTVIKRDGDLLFICCCPAGDPDKKPGADIITTPEDNEGINEEQYNVYIVGKAIRNMYGDQGNQQQRKKNIGIAVIQHAASKDNEWWLPL